MSVKIKELEELLKERYEFSGRFSHQSDYWAIYLHLRMIFLPINDNWINLYNTFDISIVNKIEEYGISEEGKQ